MRPLFVDVHSHVVPSGDDGVDTVGEGRELCHEAGRRGTRLLFATPHVWPHFPLDPEREQAVRTAYAELLQGAELELRLGFELTPSRWLLDEDFRRYELDRTGAVLIEVPFAGPADLFFACAERAEASGLRVIAAHPDRTECVLEDPQIAREIAARGWLVQVNSSSLLGRDGRAIEELGWRFLEDGTASLVASDGHRRTRPPYLDEAYALAEERLGGGALPLFDGSALGLAEAAAA